MAKLGTRDRDAIVLRFFENKNFGKSAPPSARAKTPRNAHQSRIGKVAETFRQARRDSTTTIIAWIHHGPFRSRRAGCAGEIDFHRCARQRRDGKRFHFGANQRSVETYGLDKSKNSNCGRRRGHVGPWHVHRDHASPSKNRTPMRSKTILCISTR